MLFLKSRVLILGFICERVREEQVYLLFRASETNIGFINFYFIK